MDFTHTNQSLLQSIREAPLGARSCQRVRDLMRKQIQTLDLCSTLEDSIHWMCRTGLHTVPILYTPEPGRQRFGTVTALQVLREMGDEGFESVNLAGRLERLMHRRFCCVRTDSSLREAVQKMLSYRTDMLLVSDENAVSGIVTVQDILDDMIGMGLISNALFSEDKQPFGFHLPVRRVMESNTVSLDGEASFEEAVRIFLDHGEPCLPVFDSCRRFHRLLSSQEILQIIRSGGRWEEDGAQRLVLKDTLRGQCLEELFAAGSNLLTPESTLLEAAQELRFNSLAHLPVLSDQGAYLGYVSGTSLLKMYPEVLSCAGGLL